MKHFHHLDFSNRSEFVDRLHGRRACLAIPTLNEAATIGPIVDIARRELMDTYPILDQILVVDSGSTDATCNIARDAGATVCQSAEIAPSHGSLPGKGENLWKSLLATDADLMCWIDGDIRGFHAGFVTGLLGPMLFDDSIDYVKAYYERPLGINDPSANGGRVSEILVRPILSLFYPGLAKVIQPLSGEYAARRTLLEQLPFPTGYGVEIAHLIDIHGMDKSGAIAQTDLVRRVHRNRPNAELGRMSFALMQVIFRRLHRDGHLSLNRPLPSEFHGWDFSNVHPQPYLTEIPEPERPPIAELNTQRTTIHKKIPCDARDITHQCGT